MDVRSEIIDAWVAIESEWRIFKAETCIGDGGRLADLTPEELEIWRDINDREEAIDAQITDEEYLIAHERCSQLFPDFI